MSLMVLDYGLIQNPSSGLGHKVMANEKGSSIRNIIQTGKNSLLPPKIPFPGTAAPYSDYSSNPLLASKVIPRSKDYNASHQRTSSESILMEEQPSWLDDLLNEPESPVQRRHRRSSSDSFAYMDTAGVSNMDFASALRDESKYKNAASVQLWGSQNIDQYKDSQQRSLNVNPYAYGKPRNKTWEWPLTSAIHRGALPSLRDNSQNVVSPSDLQIADPVSQTTIEKIYTGEAGFPDAKSFPEKMDDAQAMSASENDTKRAKQLSWILASLQFAQRSRVRKLQYIGELERNAEGSEVSAELDFLNRQSLILSMENKALKQRLESLAQEQLIKRLEHEMLEREISRLRALFKQQQHPPVQQQNQKQMQQRQTSYTLKRANSKDLESQFANLSLKQKDANSSTDAVHIIFPVGATTSSALSTVSFADVAAHLFTALLLFSFLNSTITPRNLLHVGKRGLSMTTQLFSSSAKTASIGGRSPSTSDTHFVATVNKRLTVLFTYHGNATAAFSHTSFSGFVCRAQSAIDAGDLDTSIAFRQHRISNKTTPKLNTSFFVLSLRGSV
ncbi:hypothetical protein V2J09_002296 [Rumex salicifolius]